MKEQRKPQERRRSIDDRRQGDRRQDERRRGGRRKDCCPRCGKLLSLTGHCSVCKIKVIKVR
ncbi:MAG: hypothetical protein L0Y56_00970 [Nitrospira sp.]|nr:hypothetical protein [Nitrospira sp.]